MELSLEGAPLSKRLSPTCLKAPLSKQAPLSRKLSRGAVSPGESLHPLLIPDLVGAANSPQLGNLSYQEQGGQAAKSQILRWY